MHHLETFAFNVSSSFTQQINVLLSHRQPPWSAGFKTHLWQTLFGTCVIPFRKCKNSTNWFATAPAERSHCGITWKPWLTERRVCDYVVSPLVSCFASSLVLVCITLILGLCFFPGYPQVGLIARLDTSWYPQTSSAAKILRVYSSFVHHGAVVWMFFCWIFYMALCGLYVDGKCCLNLGWYVFELYIGDVLLHLVFKIFIRPSNITPLRSSNSREMRNLILCLIVHETDVILADITYKNIPRASPNTDLLFADIGISWEGFIQCIFPGPGPLPSWGSTQAFESMHPALRTQIASLVTLVIILMVTFYWWVQVSWPWLKSVGAGKCFPDWMNTSQL